MKYTIWILGYLFCASSLARGVDAETTFTIQGEISVNPTCSIEYPPTIDFWGYTQTDVDNGLVNQSFAIKTSCDKAATGELKIEPYSDAYQLVGQDALDIGSGLKLQFSATNNPSVTNSERFLGGHTLTIPKSQPLIWNVQSSIRNMGNKVRSANQFEVLVSLKFTYY
ncbi:hypothetical protein [Vibrio sinus]|uniref:hypothetical protein n=1 Tax=Vibrio sinus TaxID=2946865 RepID=UPI003D7E0A53